VVKEEMGEVLKASGPGGPFKKGYSLHGRVVIGIIHRVGLAHLTKREKVGGVKSRRATYKTDGGVSNWG